MSSDILRVVMTCVGDVVPLEHDLEAQTPLLELPIVDSLTIVELLSAVESALGVELAPQLIVPATFRTPLALASAFEASGADGTDPNEAMQIERGSP